MEFSVLVNSVLPDQYTRSDYFSELSKASGCLAEERSTERLERERTEERKGAVFKKVHTEPLGRPTVINEPPLSPEPSRWETFVEK